MRYDELIESLQIFAKADTKGMEGWLNGAGHDVIYGLTAYPEESDIDEDAYLEEHGEYPPVDDKRLDAKDNARLRELGWFIDPHNEVWKHYC